MRRLLLVPVVVCPIAATAAWRKVGWLAWPIITTTWSLIAPRPDTDDTEFDPI